MKQKIMLGGVVLFPVWLFFAGAGEGGITENKNRNLLNFEAERMQGEFSRIVGNKINIEPEYFQKITANIKQLFAANNGGIDSQSQFFVYVDRNPSRQMIFVCFLETPEKEIILIGADRVSTGNQKRAGFFITPRGIFKNTIEFLGYRALGTENDEGWRGLGIKGSRVWDFGWQKTWKKNREITIRLLMHATDPVFGEKRLGRVDSKGCIRISGRLKNFWTILACWTKSTKPTKTIRQLPGC